MDPSGIMRPEVKTAAASMVTRAYQNVFSGPPKNVLLLPCTTMYDHSRMVQDFPEALYWALEKNEEVARQIQESGKFTRVLNCNLVSIGKYLEDTEFDIAYLDLQGTANFSNLRGISEALQHIPEEGMIFGVNLLQNMTRTADLVNPDSKRMTTIQYANHVKEHLVKDSQNIYLRRLDTFDYMSGYRDMKKYVTSVYFAMQRQCAVEFGTPWKPRKPLEAWRQKIDLYGKN